MNIDTDSQYAFTSPIVGHMMKNYERVLEIEDNVGNKENFDPRSNIKPARRPWLTSKARDWEFL